MRRPQRRARRYRRRCLSVPDWWEALLLALASWRVFVLLAEDDITERPRRYVTDRVSKKFSDFLTCPYCLGFWIAVGWWVAWQLWEHGTLVAAAVLAINAGLIAVYHVLSSD